MRDLTHSGSGEWEHNESIGAKTPPDGIKQEFSYTPTPGKIPLPRKILPERAAERIAQSAEYVHQMNNKITEVLGYSELILGRLNCAGEPTRVKEIKELAEIVVGSAEQAKSLVERMMVCAREDYILHMPQVIKLTEVIDRIELPVRGDLLRTGHVLEVNNAATYAVRADVQGLADGIENLVLNARDASKSGKRIWLLSYDLSHEEVRARSLQIPENQYGVIVVRDEGKGIASELLKNLFTPFTTTRSGGHGLGLSYLKRTVGEHGGYIRVKSKTDPEEKKGTKFEIYIPRYIEPKSG